MNYFENLVNEDFELPQLCVEMSGNHGGDLETAKLFVERCIREKVDCIKFQVYTPETITLESRSDEFKLLDGEWGPFEYLFDLYNAAHTPWYWIEELVKLAKQNNMAWFASPFDRTAVDFLEKLGCEAYKIASPEIVDLDLISYVAETGKPIILSTGLADQDDIGAVVELLRDRRTSFMLLHCSSAYPCPPADANLLAIRTLREKFDCPVGFSDHTLGEIAASLAVGYGAAFIEKHFKLPDDDKSVDSNFSMNLSNYEEFRRVLHDSKLMLGSGKLEICQSAKKNLWGRRSLYACADIKPGDVFSRKNIVSIRPNGGLAPLFLTSLLGRVCRRNIQFGQPLKVEDLDG